MHVEIYTKAECPACIRAKVRLVNARIPFTEKTLGTHFTREHLLEQYPTATTFPVVVVDGFYIGGANQLDEMLTMRQANTVQFLDEAEFNGS